MRTKVLCLCSAGAKRSNYLAFILKGMGYDALAAGVDMNSEETIYFLCMWADAIVIAEPHMITKIHPRFSNKLEGITIGPDKWEDTTPEELKEICKEKASDFSTHWPVNK